MAISYDIIPAPDARQRLENWNTAIGLQAVDGLVPSDKLIEFARDHIEGKSDIDEVDYQLKNYYQDLSARGIVAPERQIEADLVSANIERFLEHGSFILSKDALKRVHKAIFKGFDEYGPGEYRNYDFTKSEWVLNGDTVSYEHWEYIAEEVANLIEAEKGSSLVGLSDREKVRHFARFISELWLYHGFREGNTRAVALFAIKYLQGLGYCLDNSAFETHSLYFRNALVRDNYRNRAINVEPTARFLMMFFGNILLGEKNELKNRKLHIYWNEARQDFSNHDESGAVLKAGSDFVVPSDVAVDDTVNGTVNETVNSANTSDNVDYIESSGTVNGTVNGIVNEPADELDKTLLLLLQSEPSLSYDELAKILAKSRRTISRSIKKLKETGRLTRIGHDKGGHWVVNR